jgi:hypothetical protein
MSSTQPAIEPITVTRIYRSEALQPGGVVMEATFTMPGEGAYGPLDGQTRLKTSGVRPPGDDLGDFTVKGGWAFLGGKPGEVISLSFDSVSSITPIVGEQTDRGHMSLTNDWKTGHTTFSYTDKGGRLHTVANAKVELVN